MKYMGSKRWMLKNGLGELLAESRLGTKRFVDLFSGSGAVATHMARNFPMPVLAVDLQLYSSVLTGAIVQRESELPWERLWTNWHTSASRIAVSHQPPQAEKLTQNVVAEFRNWCEGRENLPMTRAYGGHYFSPTQGVWLDALRSSLPKDEPGRTVALAALIQAASKCAASPGHTAQPFQPTRTAKRFILDAWSKEIAIATRTSLAELSKAFAQKAGSVRTGDANVAADEIKSDDLVFLDPPYSGVHYSRFYHVLESIASGSAGLVSGTGRYPDQSLRPRSLYSLKGKSVTALSDLFGKIATKGASAILTFPAHSCSNGLSGDIVLKLAEEYFQVQKKSVRSRFSTLGGKKDAQDTLSEGRAARQFAWELILSLTPK
jgi:adenine-specific DNA-methyltransferase